MNAPPKIRREVSRKTSRNNAKTNAHHGFSSQGTLTGNPFPAQPGKAGGRIGHAHLIFGRARR